ncbi:phage tail protein [Enterovibrio norvegicus FF-162]|uniref:S41 family peptidase n=1 Tax=Enterovibrio norvegicus TaxID=188144 RepID=UPI000314945B|nr:S41 family peptidase [Enterovibrio norvegicus]OEE74425.1 phage tail protein [Enterovibrio norvegicus FF-162]
MKDSFGKTGYMRFLLLSLISASLLLGCQSTGNKNEPNARSSKAEEMYTDSSPAHVENGNSPELNNMLRRFFQRYHHASLITLIPRANNPENVEQAFSRLLQSLDPLRLVLTHEEKEDFKIKYRDLFVYPLNLSPKLAQDFYTEYRVKEKLAVYEMKAWLGEKGQKALMDIPTNALKLITIENTDQIDDRRAAYLAYKLVSLNAFTSNSADALRSVEEQLDYHLSKNDLLDFSNIGLFIEALLPHSLTGIHYISEADRVKQTLPPTPHIGAALSPGPMCYSVLSVTNKSTIDAGLRPFDCIVGMTRSGKFVALGVAPFREEQDLTIGEQGETVTLHILRNNKGNIAFHDIPVTLQLDTPFDMGANADLPHTQSLDLSIAEIDSKRVAYIWMANLYDGIADITREFLNANSPELVILDLRGNDGGSLRELSSMAGLFFGNEHYGILFDSFSRTKRISSHTTRAFDGKIIVLIDAKTSAGGEFLVAAIQESLESIVIGEQTMGVPWVIQSMPLNMVYDLFDEKLGYINYPIMEFRLLDGSRVNDGVFPDIPWESDVLKQRQYGLPYLNQTDLKKDLEDVMRLSGFAQ